MSKSALPTEIRGDRTSGFGLDSLTGPAIVAGERVPVGGRLRHVEYGLLELRGYGFTNDARGRFVKLVSVEDREVPEQWSLDCGAPRSLADAYAAGEVAVASGERK